jgi:RimJ/RimL family protein N-acetyltransferase
MRDYHLTSARLGFGWWAADDLPLAEQLWGDPAVTHYIGGPHTPEQVRQRFANQFAYRAACGQQYWPLFLRADGAFAGVCGLRPAPEDRYPASPDILELGFHLRPPFWRQGYGAEAARRVLAHAFDTLGLRAVYSCRHPENAASGNLILKLGYTPDGEQYVAPDGTVVNHAFLLRAADYRP